MSQPNRDEECRSNVLAWLAARPAVASSAEVVRRGVNRDGGDFTETELAHALIFLIGLGLARTEPNSLGSTLYYQITSQGTLAHERGTLR